MVVPPVRFVPKVTTGVAPLLQTTKSAGSFTCAVGFTVMIKFSEEPTQDTPPLVKVGVTVTVAVTGDVPPFNAVNDAILPVPLAASPMAGLLFTQE